MRISNAINLLGLEIAVVLKDDLMHEDDATGTAAYRRETIELQTPSPTTSVSRNQIEKTFCHE